MRVFLDHCVPKRLLRLLPKHEVKTAYQMGWAARKNGELLRLVEDDFEVFITVDQSRRHQQNLIVNEFEKPPRGENLRPTLKERGND